MTAWTPGEESTTAPSPERTAPEETAPDETAADETAANQAGDSATDAALARLDDLDPEDLDSQVQVFADIHSRLVHALDSADGNAVPEHS